MIAYLEKAREKLYCMRWVECHIHMIEIEVWDLVNVAQLVRSSCLCRPVSCVLYLAVDGILACHSAFSGASLLN